MQSDQRLTFPDLLLIAGEYGRFLEEAEGPSWLPVINPMDQVGHNVFLPNDELPWHEGKDSLEQVKEDLDSLPPLRWWHVDPYLYGGPHVFAGRPVTEEWVKESTGLTNPAGHVIYRSRLRKVDPGRAQTLSTIREMRRAGYSREDALRMMLRNPAKGTWFLQSQRDIGAEFERCWDKASEPVKVLPPRSFKSALKGTAEFVSHQADRDHVYSFIESNPGLGRNELLRSGCGLTGRHLEGRIKEALKVLKQQEQVRTESGPNRATFHFVKLSRVVTLPVQEDSEVASLPSSRPVSSTRAESA